MDKKLILVLKWYNECLISLTQKADKSFELRDFENYTKYIRQIGEVHNIIDSMINFGKI